ncbi:ComEC family competence protein, partial [Candidatus Pacebacteria bacterium]|nr:ComEC family competence protein [Candidatus Paceibacterota bacterium]
VTNPVFETLVGQTVELQGVIKREPDVRESSTHLYVTVEDETLLVIADRFGEYQYGEQITIEGELQRPAAFETDLGRTFNYPGYLLARDVSYLVRYAEVALLESGGGNPIIASLLVTKHQFMRTIEALMPEPQVGLSEGLLLGVKRALGEDLEAVFRQTGIIHIVVLSGYNVMLVVVFVTCVLGALIPRRWQLPFGLVAIGSFALLVGLSATVVRASIMASLYLIARSLNRTYLVLRALMLAGVGMLLFNPYLLAYDTGFQLSFVATLGLILCAPWLEARLLRVPNGWLRTREFLTATLATQIFVLPILLYQIGEFSVVSVIVNVLVLPMVPIAMLLTFITGMIGFVSSSLASVVALLNYAALSYIIIIAEFFASVPFASFVVPAFPFWVVMVLYALLGYGLYRWYVADTPVGAAERADLEGWVIEDEEEVKKRIAAEQSSAATTASDTPAFFR